MPLRDEGFVDVSNNDTRNPAVFVSTRKKPDCQSGSSSDYAQGFNLFKGNASYYITPLAPGGKLMPLASMKRHVFHHWGLEQKT